MSLFSEVAITRYGRMIVNKNDVYIGQSLLYYGEYSEWEATAFRELLQPGDAVVEVGANIGALTVPIARHVGSGHVIAIEPQRLNYYSLCGNVAINSLLNVECLYEACGAVAGHIGVPEWNPHFLCNAGGMPLGEGECRHTVPLITVDSLNLDKLDFLKADVEGMETDVLIGAQETIKKFRPLLYLEDDRDDKREGLHAILEQLGYKVYRHTTPLYNPANWRSVGENVYPGIVSMNVICVPRERDDVDIDKKLQVI
jgi:FkbM family methyltransferase